MFVDSAKILSSPAVGCAFWLGQRGLAGRLGTPAADIAAMASSAEHM